MPDVSPQWVRELLDKATPGPWHVSDAHPAEVWADRDPAGWDAFFVATVSTPLNPEPSERAENDAELIAAGPDIAQAYLATHERMDEVTRELSAEIDRLRRKLIETAGAYLDLSGSDA